MQNTVRRVLLTGATGFVGRQCVAPLEALGWDVHTVSNRGGAKYKADLLRSDEATAIIQEIKPHALLHCAWYAKHSSYWSATENMTWLQASLHLVSEFIAAGGKRFVGVGSCAEYDWTTEGEYDERNTPARPATLYGACKYALNVAGGALCRRDGVSFAWARLFFLFGPHEDQNRFVPSVIRSLMQSERAPCTAGEHIRDFMDVRDAASALARLIDSDVDGTVNIASGEGRLIKEIATTIGRVLNRSDLIALGVLPTRENDPRVLVAATNRLRSEVRWHPPVSVEQRLAETIEWWRSR
jgi:nucleoside-diphosphate-sugar epimerase